MTSCKNDKANKYRPFFRRDDEEVAVVYTRDGYTADQYPSEKVQHLVAYSLFETSANAYYS